MFELQTVNDVFAILSTQGERTVVQWQDGAGKWQPLSSATIYARVRALAAVFAGWGLVKGDRVAILAENRWEWMVTDFATLALGCVDVPLYATTTAEHVGYMLRDAGAKVAVVSTKEQYDKICNAGELPALEHVIVMDEGAPGSFGNAESFAAIMQSAAPGGADAAFDAQAASAQPGDLATIIYTSGTTGEPKGVCLTHGNLARNVVFSARAYGFDEHDRFISFLPLSHATARHADYVMFCYKIVVAYCPSFNGLQAAMQAIHPTILMAVPRVYEKIRAAVQQKSAGSKLTQTIFNWAFSVGRSQRERVLAGQQPAGVMHGVAQKLVFAKIHAAFGGAMKHFVSGGAPLGNETATWFADAGIRIYEGYGMTETSPVVSANTPEAFRLGSVGKPLPNIECRIAADGELEVRGETVFSSYWQREKETAEAFTPDGWYKTGDIGNLDGGLLSITDRKKELLKTSGGKLIAPQPIENTLKANNLVGQAALVGDRHKFASLLISPNFVALEGWAKSKGIATNDAAELVAQPQVVKLYQGVVDGVNKGLAQYESIKRFALVPEEWTIEGGEMTPSMKLKRRIVEKKYKDVIDGFYKDEDSGGA